MNDFEKDVIKKTDESIDLQRRHLSIGKIGLFVAIIGLFVAIIGMLGPDNVMDFLKDLFRDREKTESVPPSESISKLIESLKKEPLTPKRLAYLKEHINFIQGPFSLAELNSILDTFPFKEHKFEITELLQPRIKDDHPASELERFLNQFNKYQQGKALRLLKGRN